MEEEVWCSVVADTKDMNAEALYQSVIDIEQLGKTGVEGGKKRGKERGR